jgi:hypothetical protein
MKHTNVRTLALYMPTIGGKPKNALTVVNLSFGRPNR